MSHVPVMAGEVMDLVEASRRSLLLDLTVGAGGHASAFLAASAPTGQVVGCDRDPVALDTARRRLAPEAGRVRLVQGDSAACCRELASEGLQPDVILLDLGVSSMQMDDELRGFALRFDAPLDMRMDPESPRTAADLLNQGGHDELLTALREWGGEPRAARLVEAILRRRKQRPFRTTGDLRTLVETTLGRKGGRIHPATRTFQGLRVAVNRELDLLDETLPLALELLEPGGDLAVISFHSGEDRRVKSFMRERAREGAELITPRAVMPSRAEHRANRRSRSARLRVLRTGSSTT